jgi:hypothetical protein
MGNARALSAFLGAVFGWAVALLVLLPNSADAAVRDDVMAGAFHCSDIGDSQQWLDCYYGAAQPMRALLGIPAATPAQIGLARSPPVTGNHPSADQIQVRNQVLANAFSCTSAAENRVWLDCYYGASTPERDRLGLARLPSFHPGVGSSAAATLQPLVPSGEGNPANSFGLPRKPEIRGSDQITSRLVAYKFQDNGTVTIALSNGETWRQLEGDTAFVKLTQPAASYVATIRVGILGSYNLTIRGLPGLFRVQRVE